jgi:EAL domain-containing protein (putative c-di-GMP-specific phosphodiesterase class I)
MRIFSKSPLHIALAVALVCWGFLLTEAFDYLYWNQRYKPDFMTRPAPADKVIVSLDAGRGSTEERAVGSTASQARLLRAIIAQNPKHIFFDLPIAEGADAAGDKAFAKAVADAGQRVTMVLRANNDASSNIGVIESADSMLPADTQFAASIWYLNFNGYATGAPPVAEIGGKPYPAVAALHQGDPALDEKIVPDWSINPRTIPVIDSGAILSGSTGDNALSGKTIFVTTTNPNLGTSIGYFGRGRTPSATLDIAGIEGMKNGSVTDLGSLPLLLLFVLLIQLGRRARSPWTKLAIYCALVLSVLFLPAVLMSFRILTHSGVTIVALLAYVPARLWQRWRRSVELTNGSSGLPNIDALAADGIPDGYDVVGATIRQYEQMLASLPCDLHGECARQIARRLSLASGDSKVYATDNGHFVWLEEPRSTDSQVGHLEGLKALFSAPLMIDGHLLDTNIHFGLDRNIENSPASRIQSALASANEALAKGKLYEEFGRQKLEQAPWELSLHARIDEGLRNGDIWLALQAKYDLRTDSVTGAEALIRWNDPERGVIPPDAFILQAERAGRIEAITYWVFERAMEYSRELNKSRPLFNISVNLSARMVDQPGLVPRVSELAARYNFDCTLLTFEVTETFDMANHEMARHNLAALRAMGFRLSIDDFGTGQASLAYLAEIPSDEIKLDRRFVQSITTDKRERLIVRSIIKLAHALGQEVVAEGVEDEATLEALRWMNCDVAQGFHIGRPIRFEELAALLTAREENFNAAS